MKKSLIYLGISIFVFIFGQIYEYFSHGVYSSYMMFVFLIPFIGLFIPSLLNNLILKSSYITYYGKVVCSKIVINSLNVSHTK